MEQVGLSEVGIINSPVLSFSALCSLKQGCAWKQDSPSVIIYNFVVHS